MSCACRCVWIRGRGRSGDIRPRIARLGGSFAGSAASRRRTVMARCGHSGEVVGRPKRRAPRTLCGAAMQPQQCSRSSHGTSAAARQKIIAPKPPRCDTRRSRRAAVPRSEPLAGALRRRSGGDAMAPAHSACDRRDPRSCDCGDRGPRVRCSVALASGCPGDSQHPRGLPGPWVARIVGGSKSGRTVVRRLISACPHISTHS
jgi:hypothetical protein